MMRAGRAELVGGVMAGSLVESLRVLRAALVSFQPEVYSGDDCAVLRS